MFQTTNQIYNSYQYIYDYGMIHHRCFMVNICHHMANAMCLIYDDHPIRPFVTIF